MRGADNNDRLSSLIDTIKSDGNSEACFTNTSNSVGNKSAFSEYRGSKYSNLISLNGVKNQQIQI